jgi:metal-sulfur cluster biosynthetic enzyme
VKEAEQESERKSIESMRDEVIKILDEVVEEDSTVTITFDMQWTPSWVN